METVVRRIDFRNASGEVARQLLRREWLATNGLGGYASGTISGGVSWRYHGLLIAALPAPFGRMVMLSHLQECLRLEDGRRVHLGGAEPSEPEELAKMANYLTEFRLENGLPIWRYEFDGIVLEKHLLFLYGQNTVHVNYHLVDGNEDVRLELRPSMQFRGHEQSVDATSAQNYEIHADADRYEVILRSLLPRLRLVLNGDKAVFTYDGGSRRELYYPKEAERGSPQKGSLWSPGFFGVTLHRHRDATLIASTEWWSTMLALTPVEALDFYHTRHQRLISLSVPAAQASPAADLVLAADQFIINPVGRIQDAARAHAAGDDIRTVIAGYHWFTDWGRDTMISLEGLTLTTQRFTEAAWILRTFAYYIRNGLLPNLFPEGKSEGLYNTADATLWFFHALDRYVELSGDRATLRLILPTLIDIVDHHLRGTDFGIKVDAADGLLYESAPGYQLTWMDAKVGDWVVTPRRGKAVEINGLWYNALRLLEGWLREDRGEADAKQLPRHPDRAKDSFNAKFWYAEGNYLLRRYRWRIRG